MNKQIETIVLTNFQMGSSLHLAINALDALNLYSIHKNMDFRWLPFTK